MRATVSLVVPAVVAMAIVVGTGAPSAPSAPLLAAGPEDPARVLSDGFDGLLYPDPGTGCVRPWREGDGDPVTADDIRGLRSAPPDASVSVQDAEPMPEPFGELHRRPWPICDEPPTNVQDGGP